MSLCLFVSCSANEGATLRTVADIFSTSEKVRNRNYQKVYAIDWALADAVAPGEGVDATRQLENMVYLELRRRGWDVSYFRMRQGWEVDFVAVRKAGKCNQRMILQVAYSIQGAEARERELRGLPETARHLRADRVIVVTFNDEETLDLAGTCVQVVPAWRWLVEDDASEA